ncbi:hypothetical protein FNV43_RR02654 [Rhamnella rubrinervis]|uniref:Uncharacterized protein n=1 Tax=Rhamnella rubrinervis TaxID=2594499 RepID=A0A8K0HRZ8_9ROSA|nr:hypothetical protein FNV43_RR02654 [Rhamnella rubrinervis]
MHSSILTGTGVSDNRSRLVSSSTPEELSEIVELPSLGTSFESAETGNELVFADTVDGWLYPTPWYHHSFEEDYGFFRDQKLMIPADT